MRFCGPVKERFPAISELKIESALFLFVTSTTEFSSVRAQDAFFVPISYTA